MAQVTVRRRHVVPVLTVGVLGLSSGAVWAVGSPISIPPLLPGWPTTTTTTVVRRPPLTTPTTATSTSTTVAPSGRDFNPLVGTVPPEDQKQIDAFRATPPGSTAPLITALGPLAGIGMSAGQAAIVGFGRFPVAGAAVWSDDFLGPRFDEEGTFQFHHATDISAACGTPVRAPDEGVLTHGSDPGGGTTVEITEPDGTYLYLAHLSGYAAGTVSGQTVRVGEVIGYVGQTGAATGCHLHVEIHPRGGEPVDPKPFLDAWYADALAKAPLLVDALDADAAP